MHRASSQIHGDLCITQSFDAFGAHQKIRSTGVALLLHYAARGE